MQESLNALAILCQNHIYLQACVLSVNAEAGMLGSSNPKLIVNVNPTIQN